VARYDFKTLKDSRWAPKNLEAATTAHVAATHSVKTIKDSRWANTTEAPTGRGIPGFKHAAPSFRREPAKYGSKTPNDSRFGGKKTDVPEKNEFEGRVAFNKEELNREFAKYGLKTLKDSRWAN
jgi:hypothetical protein